MDRDKLLERVRKLYAMSQATESSPHEAEIALRRCQSLMEKFGICESDLATSDFAHSTAGKPFRSIPTHVRILTSAVALLHDCMAVDMGDRMQFRGFSIDAEVAPLTFDYLIASMERSLRDCKRRGEVPGGRKASYDYRIGYAFALLERCRAIDRERRAQAEAAHAEPGTSLVVRKIALVREACSADLAQSTRARKVLYRPGSAHSAGQRDGQRVSLRDQIETS